MYILEPALISFHFQISIRSNSVCKNKTFSITLNNLSNSSNEHLDQSDFPRFAGSRPDFSWLSIDFFAWLIATIRRFVKVSALNHENVTGLGRVYTRVEVHCFEFFGISAAFANDSLRFKFIQLDRSVIFLLFFSFFPMKNHIIFAYIRWTRDILCA